MKTKLLLVILLSFSGLCIAQNEAPDTATTPQEETGKAKSDQGEELPPTQTSPEQPGLSPDGEKANTMPKVDNLSSQTANKSMETSKELDQTANIDAKYLQLLLGLIILLSGCLLGYLLALVSFRKKRKKLEQELSLQREKIDRLEIKQSKTPTITSRVIASPATVPEVKHSASTDTGKLISTLENAVKGIENAVAKADPNSRITLNLNRALNGLSENYPGIRPTLTAWRLEHTAGKLDLNRVYQDLNSGEMRKALSSLYAISSYPRLKGIGNYYEAKNINHKLLASSSIDLFKELKSRAKIRFKLPPIGEPLVGDEFDLIDKNLGPIHNIDDYSLTNILKESMATENRRIIIDVAEIGLPDPPAGTTVVFDYPRKAIIGVLSK